MKTENFSLPLPKSPEDDVNISKAMLGLISSEDVPFLRGVWLDVELSHENQYQDQFGTLLKYTGGLNNTGMG